MGELENEGRLMSLVTITNVYKTYHLGAIRVTAVSDITLTLHRNRLTVIATRSFR